MKKDQIKIGRKYRMKVSGLVVTVRVDNIKVSGKRTTYYCTNMKTLRTCQAHSASKFRTEVDAPAKKPDRTLFDNQEIEKKELEERAMDANPTKAGPSGDGTGAPATPTEGKKRPNPTVRGTASSKPTAASGKPGEDEKRPDPIKPRSSVTTQTGSSSSKPTGVVSPAHPSSLNRTMTPRSSPVAAAVRRAWPGETPNGKRNGSCAKPTVAKSPLSQMLEKAVRETEADKSPHVIVKARAGTGKTFTLVVGVVNMFRDRIPGLWKQLIDHLGFDPKPSPQQAMVWEAMKLSAPHAKNIQLTAFNKGIVEDFEAKWSWVVQLLAERDICFAFNTLNSLGNTAVSQAFSRPQVTTWNVQDIIAELLEMDLRVLTRSRPNLLTAVEALVEMCKSNLVQGTDDADWEGRLDMLAGYYDIELENDRAQAFRLVPQVLERCKTPKGRIDFNDQIWLPVVLNLSVAKVDLLLVDEAQDLNKAKQELAKKIGRRIILVGDDRQAIYGFAGADHESLPRMLEYLKDTPKGCLELPLTVTRRCGKAIVHEARKYELDFEAHEDNPEGQVSHSAYECSLSTRSDYRDLVQSGDMILCRLNAPLVSQCFKFLRDGRKATILGRDMVKGLTKAVDRHWKADRSGKGPDIYSFGSNIDDWLATELRKENAKRFPNETRIISIQDRASCLKCFAADLGEEDAGPIGRCKILRKIEAIFTDNKEEPGILLSSIHKAKGMEAKRVFLLQPKGAKMPHPSAKTVHARMQEYNLLYVAITRAIEELIHVS